LAHAAHPAIQPVILLRMKFVRTFFALLLCALLPVTGLAASGLVGPCPTQTATSSQAGAMSPAMPGCDGMKSTSDTHDKAGGQLCKMTAQCQADSLYHPVSLPVLSRPAGRFNPLRFHYAEACPSRGPDGLWRPPRSL
jgi:hypothetical protein